MDPQSTDRSVEATIGSLADRQQGVVARPHLLALGISPTQIRDRTRKGLLRLVHRGVYLVGHRAPARFSREMAAALACGPKAVVSHRSAAAMFELLSYPASGDVWITVPTEHPRRRPGVRVVRARLLASAELGRLDGVPITSPARTLLDLAAVVDEGRLEGAIAEAEVRSLVKLPDLYQRLERDRGRPGADKLRKLLDRDIEPARTRSRAERMLLALIRSNRLPEPETNTMVGPYEVDLLWRQERVVAEFDSRQFHAHRRAFKRDRDRTNELQLRGYVVLRLTWEHVTRERERTVVRLRCALSPERSMDWG